MELSLLLAVLASLQVFSTLASPEAPTLSLDPPHQEFFEEENLILRCSAPEAEEPKGYLFFNQGNGKLIYKTPPDLYMEGQMHLTAQLEASGMYSCAYWKGESEQESPSEKSRPISVQVKAAPPAPSLSLNPRHVKNLVGLLCSVPSPVADVRGFQYFGDVGMGVAAIASSQSSYIYNLTITGPEVVGSYRCSYWVRLSGRNIQAKRSESVIISLEVTWTRELAVGGLFFTLNSLIFLITYFRTKHKGSQQGHRTEIQAPSRSSKSLQGRSYQSVGEPQSQVNVSLLPDSVSQSVGEPQSQVSVSLHPDSVYQSVGKPQSQVSVSLLPDSVYQSVGEPQSQVNVSLHPDSVSQADEGGS